MGKVVAFGEVMMRLSPPGFLRLGQSVSFDVTYGGAEANVCVALAQLGIGTSFVTKLPDNPLGDGSLLTIAGFGVDVSSVSRGGLRIGVYYCEKGAAVRPPRVIYDRKDSSIATAVPDDFDWAEILSGADAFYFTGITPALSDTLAEIVRSACEEAKKLGVFIACDMNYRSALWSREKASEVMSGLLPYCDLLMAGVGDARLLGIAFGSPEEAALRISEKFSIPRVASTLREDISASDNALSGLFLDSGEIYRSKEYPIHIVDRVGGGDAFSAGILRGCLLGLNSQETVDFSVAAAALAHTTEGDFPYFTLAEINALAGGNSSGRIIR